MISLSKQLTVPVLLVLMYGAALPGNLWNRPMSSVLTTQTSPLSDAAYLLLSDRVNANRTNYYVYQDSDSGFNHGFPSGFFGDINKIYLNAACLDDSVSASGCSSDMSRLDQTRGTVLSITFDPLQPGHFAGINIEDPENYGANPRGAGYDLRGATEVVFDVRTPTPGGINMQFGVGGPGHATSFIPITQNWTTKRFTLSSLNLSSTDLSNVHILFTVVTNDLNAPNGATVLLDNIRFEPVPTSQQSVLSFPLGNQTFGVVPQGNGPFPSDQVLRNLTTIYESAATLLALLKRGMSQDLNGARLIADAFVYALDHDNHGAPLPVAPDGAVGLHNGYSSGDLALFNDQGPGQGQKGDIRLSGFTCSISNTGFCLVLDGATGGNEAFAILALAAAYKQFSDVRYLNTARKIGRWITGNLTDTTGTGYGGYYLGYQDEGVPPPKPLIKGKSVENNADIFAAFAILAAIERALSNISEADTWTNRANVAGDFVIQMYDSVNGRFNAGTVPVGTPSGPGITPNPSTTRGDDVINTFDFLDSNSFTTLALAASSRYRNQINWRRPVQYILSHFAQTITVGAQTFDGFNIVQNPTAGRNGIAWEFTGQAVVLMRFVDRLYRESNFEGNAVFYLNQIRQAQTSAPFGDGRGLVASTLQDGNTLPPIEQCLATPFQCIPERVGLAATTWSIFADQRMNPLSSPPIDTVGVHNPAGGAFFLKNSHSLAPADTSFTFGPTGGIAVAGDWDGDGVDTIGVFKDGFWYLKNSNSPGNPDLIIQYGATGDQPIVGDWDGDGKDGIGVFFSGGFYLSNSVTQPAVDYSIGYGVMGDIAIAGDWNGDGRDTIGVYNPAGGAFFLTNSFTSGIADYGYTYGPPAASPVMGDWNGDGVTTPGIYTGNTFFLRNSNTPGYGELGFSFGSQGNQPIAGHWIAGP